MQAGILHVYGSGAGSDGGANPDPEADLGSFRANREIVGLEWTEPRDCKGVRILYADPGNLAVDVCPRRKAGTLRYYATAGTLTWQAPDSVTEGAAVVVSAGGDFEIGDGADQCRCLRVTVTAADLGDVDAIDPIVLVAKVHQGHGEISAAEGITGMVDYRLHVLRNPEAGAALPVEVSFHGRTDVALALAQDYAAAGAVLVYVAQDLDALGWARRGMLLNAVTGEILYFYRRTSSYFFVASDGRGAMGTAAAGGTAADTLYDQAPVKIGFEAPGVGGDYQVIANKTTAPGGVAFLNARYDGIADGPQAIPGGIPAGAHRGVWVARYAVAGSVEDPWARFALIASHTYAATLRESRWLVAWQHRATPTRRIYWNGGSGAVDVAWPIAIPTVSPYVSAVLPGGINDFYVREFDGLYEERNTRLLRVEVEGDYVGAMAGRPRTPDSLYVVPGPAGAATVSAAYLRHDDPHPATEAALFWDAGTGTLDYAHPKAAWTPLAFRKGGRAPGRTGGESWVAFPSFAVAGLAHGTVYQFSILVRSAAGVESLTPGYVEVVGDSAAPSEVTGAAARGT